MAWNSEKLETPNKNWKDKRKDYLSCQLEVSVGAVACRDDAVALVEAGDKDHPEAEHVADGAKGALVLNLGGCNIDETISKRTACLLLPPNRRWLYQVNLLPCSALSM